MITGGPAAGLVTLKVDGPPQLLTIKFTVPGKDNNVILGIPIPDDNSGGTEYGSNSLKFSIILSESGNDEVFAIS